MEENLHDNDFEKFLREQVKQHRMYPSDKIWRNINHKLHNNYTWPVLTIVAFAFIGAIIGITVYFSPGPNIFAVTNVPENKKQSNTGVSSSPLITPLSNNKKVVNISDQDQHFNNKSGTLTGINKTADNSLAVNKRMLNKLKGRINIKKLDQDEFQLNNNLPVEVTAKAVRIPELRSNITNESSLNIKQATETNIAGILENKAYQNDEINSFDPPTEFTLPAKSLNKKKKFSYQVYITPSASYRKLKEDRTTTKQQASNVGGPVAINYISDVNQVVRHKPGSGMEAGVLFGYNLTKKLKINTGLQVNARQYLIEAFLSTTEVATIAFASGSGVDSLTSLSSYRTSTGYEAAELNNRYYQLSIPVGIDYIVAGNDVIGLNIAATIQPTYLITRNVFLISTDFKNYIQSPKMTRSWNINAAIESYISIKSGNYKWQLGPQLRYQMLPTSINKYPIKEYLIDYGIKIGVSKGL